MSKSNDYAPNKLLFSLGFPEHVGHGPKHYVCRHCTQPVAYGLMIDNLERLGQFCSLYCAIERARIIARSTGSPLYYIRHNGHLLHIYDAGLVQKRAAQAELEAMRAALYGIYEGQAS